MNRNNTVADQSLNDIKLIANKLEYVQNVYKEIKKKFSELQSEKLKIEQNYLSKLDVESEKIEILTRQLKDLESNIEIKNKNIKTLTDSNKNLINEVSLLNVSNNDLRKTNEIKNSELDFMRKELEK